MIFKAKSKEIAVVRVILLLALVLATITFIQDVTLTGLTSYENQTNESINSSIIWVGNTSLQINKNSNITIDLSDYFISQDGTNLTYLGTVADKIRITLIDNLLTIIPAQDFAGERTISVIAADEINTVKISLRLIIGTEEERALSPVNITVIEETITKEINITEQITKINISKENLTNITQIESNASAISALETEDNTSIKKFDINEKIKDKNNKQVGKKIKDEEIYETLFTSIEKNESGLELVFHHNASVALPVWIKENINYTLSTEIAQPFENITLFVPRVKGIIPKFNLHVGITSDVFEFGKTIPDVIFNGESTLIDRDDEKIDIKLTKEDAKAEIKGAIDVEFMNAKVAQAKNKIIKTDVFAANNVSMDNAVISLPKQGNVNTIMECIDFNLITDSCPSQWIKTNIPFEQNSTHITFTVNHFSGYAGAEITILNVQSYPVVGGEWTVRFTTSGTANLTISAVNETTWSNSNENEDLKFLEIKCGNTSRNYSWIDDSVFVEDYYCNETGYETSKVLISGAHRLKFTFGDDVGYANNLAVFWSKYYDGGTASDQARSVAIDADDNVIATGFIGSPSNIFTVKHDINGTELWNATIYGGNAYDITINDSINDIVIVGTKSNDVIIIKYNSSGNQTWNNTYDGLYNDVAYAVAVNDTGDIIVGGYGINLSRPVSGLSREDWLLVKYNPTGSELWNKNYSFSATGSMIYDIAFDSANNIIATGYVNNLEGSGFRDWLTIKFNSSGDQLWNRTVIGDGSGSSWSVAVDSSDNIILGGDILNTTSSSSEFFMIKYDSTGAHQWNKTYDTPAADLIYSVAVNSTDAITVTGSSNSNWLTIRYDASGTQQWNETNIPGTPYGVAINSMDDTLVAGISNGDFLLVSYATRSRPNVTQIFINSSFGRNVTTENITCYVNITDYDDVNLNAYFNWYNNTKWYSSGITSVTNATLTNISTIDSSLTTVGDNWTCEVKGWDGEFNETDWNNASIIIRDNKPNTTQVILNSTYGTNFTEEDLTCYVNLTDNVNTSLIVYYNWYNNSVHIPSLSGSTSINSGILTNISTINALNTSIDDIWTCEVKGWDGESNESDWNNASFTIKGCGDVSRSMILIEDRTANNTCFSLLSSNISLDCVDYTILGNRSGYGIIAQSLKNITITNCNISSFKEGIFINYTNSSIIKNNKAVNNSDEGIELRYSHYCNLTNNTASFNSGYGIRILYSNYSQVINNSMNNNSKSGLYLDHELFSSKILSNVINGNSANGFIAQFVFNSTFYNNIIKYNNLGFLMDDSDNNSISNNNFDNNSGGSGLYIRQYNDGNTFSNNSANNNAHFGFWIKKSDNNTFVNNTANNNACDWYDGMHLLDCHNNTIQDNIFNGNDYAGIYLSQSHNNTVYNNIINDTIRYYGLYVSGSDDNNISKNSLNNNTKRGIYVYYGNKNIIHRNIVKNSSHSIYIRNSDNNLIYDNYFENKPYANAASTGNDWNTSKTLGTNIIGGPYIGGNFWWNYNGTDTTGDLLGDTDIPWKGITSEIVNGGDSLPLTNTSNLPPNTTQVIITSSLGTNFTTEDITCWANISEDVNTTITAYFNWYNDSVQIPSLSGSTLIPNSILTNISTIDSANTTIGETWTCEVKGGDGLSNETDWNNATITILAAPIVPPPGGSSGWGIGVIGGVVPAKEVECVESWMCESWSECFDGMQTRNCFDWNDCKTSELKPSETQYCAYLAKEFSKPVSSINKFGAFVKQVPKIGEFISSKLKKILLTTFSIVILLILLAVIYLNKKRFSKKKTVQKYKRIMFIILLIALVLVAITSIKDVTLTGLIASENKTNSLPIWNSNSTWQISKNLNTTFDLNDYFKDPDHDTITYLATEADKVSIRIVNNLLTIIPAQDFTGERTISILASDEFDAVKVNVKILIGTEEERALSPVNITVTEETITEELNITEEINISEQIPEINISEENLTNTTQIESNASAISALETEDNTSIKKFDIDEKIKDKNNKHVGKKVKDEEIYETLFTSIEKNESGLSIMFHHNASVALPVWIKENVNYTLSTEIAQPFENITLFVPRVKGIIPKFKLHVGITSDVFEFGKTVPEITFNGESSLIDRDDEKIDINLVKDSENTQIIGALDIETVNAKFSSVTKDILKTKVFSADNINIDYAIISLEKQGTVNTVMECLDFDTATNSCPSQWIKTNIPFEQNSTHITFTVNHFSGYAGAEITILNVQSYPVVGGEWTVRFTTSGTANLTISAVNETTWSNSNENNDLKFLEVKCGDITQSYQWINNKVFIENYNCNQTSHEKSKVITSGAHILEFNFGGDVKYAKNYAQSYWSRKYNVTKQDGERSTGDYGQGVVFDSEQNVIVAGYSILETAPSSNWFIIKYNSTGTHLWNQTISWTKQNVARGHAYQLDTDSSDNIIVVGHNGSDGAIVKYNSTGSLLWNVSLPLQFNVTWLNKFNDVEVDFSDNITVVGDYYNSTIKGVIAVYNSTGSQLWNATNLNRSIKGVSTDSSGNVFAISDRGHIYKYDLKGSHQWNITFNTTSQPGTLTGQDIKIDSSDEIIAIAKQWNASSSTYKWIIDKYDSNGDLLWNVEFQNTTAYGPKRIDTNSNDEIAVTGDMDVNNTAILGASGYYTAILNSSGNLTSYKTYVYLKEEGGYDLGCGVAINDFDEVVVTGETVLSYTLQRYAFTIKYATLNNTVPSTTQSLVNMSGDGTLNCYANGTDTEDSTITAYYYWISVDAKTGVETLVPSHTGTTDISKDTLSLVSTLPTTAGPSGVEFRCYVKMFDSSEQELLWSYGNYTRPLVCGNTLNTNTVNYLLQDATTTTDCFTLGGHNITLDCQGNAIRGDLTTSGDYAIYCAAANCQNNFTMKNCFVYNFSRPLYRYFIDTVIYNNTFVNQYSYLYFNGADRLNITNNNFSNQRYSAGAVLYVRSSDNFILKNNYFFNNSGYDIWFSANLQDNRIINNTIDVNNKNKSSIYSTGSGYILYTARFENNTIKNQGTGTNSWGYNFQYVKVPYTFIGNNSVNTENMSDYFIFNKSNLLIQNLSRGKTNVFYHGQLGMYLCDNVTIKNNLFENHSKYAMHIHTISNLSVFNNTLHNGSIKTFQGNTISNATFENNTITTGAGLYLYDVTGITINNNTIQSTSLAAVDITAGASAKNFIVKENNIDGVNWGLRVYNSITNLSIYNNVIKDSTTGIWLGTGGTGYNNNVYNNTIYGFTYGISNANLCTNISFNRISNSTGITEGYRGITTSQKANISNNSVTNCGVGLNIYYVQGASNVYGNNFTNNSVWGIRIDPYLNLARVKQNITSDNLINGRPPYYYVEQDGLVIENMSLRIGQGVNTGVITLAYCSNVRINNNTFASNGSSASYGLASGIGIFNLSDSIISNNTINSTDYGIYIRTAYPTTSKFNNNTISNNLIINTTSDMIRTAEGAINTTIKNNTFKHLTTTNRYGIYLNVPGSNKYNNNNITHNRFYNLSNGIYIYAGNNNNIEFNTFDNITNQYAIGLGYGAPHNKIKNNTLTNIANTAIFMYGYSIGSLAKLTKNNSISFNYINNTKYGIREDRIGANNTIFNNSIYGATTAALRIYPYSNTDAYVKQDIYHNTICYNTLAIDFFTSFGFDNTRTHNNSFCIRNENPLNGTNTTDTQFDIAFNATNIFNLTDTNCTVFIDAINYGYNDSMDDNSITNITMTSAAALGWHNLSINCSDEHDNYQLANTIEFEIRANRPNTELIFINSSFATNYSNENLTCWVNMTDVENSTLLAHFSWYNNSVKVPALSGTTNITADFIVNISTIAFTNTTKNENWTCEARGWDGTVNETDFNNASILIRNTLPVHDLSPILNSTFGTNLTAENLTVYANVSDIDGDSIKNITTWYLNGTSIMVLNMPFESWGTNSTGHNISNMSKDYTPYGNNGTVIGATYNATGGYDGRGAFNFNGTSDYLHGSNLPDVGNNANITLSAWIYPNALPAGRFTVFSKGLSGTCFNYGMNIINGELNSINTAGYGSLSGTVVSNKWQHVVVVYNRTNSLGYIDGIFVGSSGTTTTTCSDLNWVLGVRAYNSLTEYFNGSIDDVLIFNRSLSAEQILALNNSRTDLIVSQETTRGETWKACITPNDGEDDGLELCSNNLTINNTAPTITSVDVTPNNPNTSSILTCTPSGFLDADGDSATYFYAWYDDQVIVSGQTASTFNCGAVANCDINNNITCEVTVNDGETNGTRLNGSELIENILPNTVLVKVNSSLGNNYTTEDIICYINATDYENTSLIAYFNWYTDSVLSSSGSSVISNATLTNISTIDSSLTTAGENWTCEVKAYDGYTNESDWNNASLTILAVPVSPTGGIPGGSAGGGGGPPSVKRVITVCNESWSCGFWSPCVDNLKHRWCYDINNCGTIENKPEEVSKCSVPEAIEVLEKPVIEEPEPVIKDTEPPRPSFFTNAWNKIIAVSNWCISNTCFILIIFTYILLIIAAIFAIIYFLTRNYFENINRYIAASYVLISIVALLLMITYAFCEEVLMPAFIAIVGITSVFVLDILITFIIRQGVEYWQYFKYREVYQDMQYTSDRIKEINRGLGRKIARFRSDTRQFKEQLKRPGITIRKSIRNVLNNIHRFNASLKQKIDSGKRPEFEVYADKTKELPEKVYKLSNEIAKINAKLDKDMFLEKKRIKEFKSESKRVDKQKFNFGRLFKKTGQKIIKKSKKEKIKQPNNRLRKKLQKKIKKEIYITKKFHVLGSFSKDVPDLTREKEKINKNLKNIDTFNSYLKKKIKELKK